MQSGHWRYRPHEKIQVCSAQTLERKGEFPGLNLLIVDEVHQQRQQTLEFIKNNTNDNSLEKFTTLEYEKFRRVVDYMETTIYTEEKLKEGRKDFYNWFTEYDRRRGTDFVSTFPELVDFYNNCKDE
jgi:hypothetical protein